MELLIRARPFLVAAFFLGLSGFALGIYMDRHSVFVISVVTAHLSLFLFTATESFGRVAQLRSRAGRVMARIFFSMYVVVFGGSLLTFAVAFDHVF